MEKQKQKTHVTLSKLSDISLQCVNSFLIFIRLSVRRTKIHVYIKSIWLNHVRLRVCYFIPEYVNMYPRQGHLPTYSQGNDHRQEI